MMNKHRRVFITGASSGLGAGLARYYARPGAEIGLLARRADLLQDLANEVAGAGATAHLYCQDVRDTDAMGKVIEQYLQHSGGIDVVIANAGVGLNYNAHEASAKQAATLMHINVTGVINTLLPFLPVMRSQREGTLVALSSVAGFRALPWRSAYCASKAAVRIYMDGLRMELHASGVHAMTICPGFVDTALTQDTPDRMFLLDVPTAVRKITRAIEKRRKTYIFPWPWRLLNPIWTLVPEVLLRKLVPPTSDMNNTPHP